MTSMAASAIITKAYQDAQRVARDVTPNATQMVDGHHRLNDLINFFQTRGMKLFLEEEVSVTLVADQQIYSFRPGGDVDMERPLRATTAAYWDSNDVSRPLDFISRDEWARLSDRTQTGYPNQVFVEKLYDRLNLHLWPIPDSTAAAGTLKVTVRTQATNPATTSDNALFAPEWAMALRWGLADELAAGMPEAVQARCAQRAAAYRAALEDFDVEDTEVSFRPSTHYGGSRFR